MSALIVTCLLSVLAADPQTSGAHSQGRRFHEIDRDISAALRQEASAKNFADRAAAVRDLVSLFNEVRHDERTATSPALQEYRGRVRSRLVSVQKRLKQQIAREASSAKRKSGDSLDAELALAETDEREAAAAIAAQISLAAYSMGGPARLVEAAASAPGGGAVLADNGPALVDLIQRTIVPDVWDVNGGPCTIVYYRPLMCLVVRATGDTHRNVGNLLQGLRIP